jgi:outer membrane protein assembly factor BamE (lipoprotein component of BamABCDE complex)
MQLSFDGRREAGDLSGTYRVSARDGTSTQNGTFALKKISATASSMTVCAETTPLSAPPEQPSLPAPTPAPRVATVVQPVNVAPSVAPDRTRLAPTGYFTVGSTKDEVLAVQGTPTRLSDYQWGYGLSHVSFQNGRVIGWYVSPVNGLRVKMLPDSEIEASAARARGYFTAGSSRDEVLAVQGTPTSFSDVQWVYGLSHVSFQNGRVVSWYVSPVNSLRVRMLASDGSAPVRPAAYFTVGSTKDEVLAVQGTPTSFSEAQWAYGLSHVSFQNGRVVSWYVSPVNSLRVRNAGQRRQRSDSVSRLFHGGLDKRRGSRRARNSDQF